MKLHIVGGFLGGGKTTAIINAAKVLSTEGKKVGVITNDQYLIDTAFVKANYSPFEEVINGCFSSDLDSLSDKIVSLNQNTQLDYIFAESVGSCTDLVSTVVKPLMIFNKNIFECLTLSIFIDARLLLSFLKGDNLLFSDDVIYIIDKQIEEADILIISKIDLLAEAEFPMLKKLVDKMLRGRMIITQNSFSPQNIDNWLDTLENLPPRKREPLEIDYQAYGNGEAKLIWLNEEIKFSTLQSDACEFAFRFIENIVNTIRRKQIPIGHLKFLLINGEAVQKISFTAIYDEDWKKSLSFVSSKLLKLVMNARIETTHEIAHTIIKNEIASISNNKVHIKRSNAIAFQSGHSATMHHIKNTVYCCEECICLKNILARNAARLKDGSATALAELENEQFECSCDCSDGDGCCC
ncbi:MAG: hypothetical protein HXX14_09400 [Bacteroidetes bacterium]|nr:hypothetical protein [Bacteroidota bacterium]